VIVRICLLIIFHIFTKWGSRKPNRVGGFKKQKMNKFLFISLILVMLFSSCKKEENDLPSSYPSLYGSYTHSFYESWEDGLYERSRYISYDFDDTRKSWYYSRRWSYTTSGWSNAIKESNSWDLEWKVEDGKFKERLWDNEYADWYSHDFEFINSNEIKIDGYTFYKD
jgi:hypothetical protein